jgi:hypothetical protein
MERVHVNYSADRLGVIFARRVAHVALQFRLGVLPEWRSGFGSCDCAHFGFDGSSLAQGNGDLKALYRRNEESH